MTITPISPRRAFLLIAVFTGMVWAQLLPLLPAQINGMMMPICTLQGVQSIVVSEEGDVDPARTPASSRMSCPMCILRDLAVFSPPEFVQVPSYLLTFEPVIYEGYVEFISSYFAGASFQARAPPVL